MTPEVDPVEAWNKKFGPPSSPPEDPAVTAWNAKFGIHDHAAAHQGHLDAVDQMLSNVRDVGDEITQRFTTAPVPIPAALDNTTPDPRNIFQRVLDRDKDAAASIASGLDKAPQALAEGLNAIGPYGGMPGQQARPNPLKTLAGGLNEASRGAMTLGEPLLGAGLVAAPIATAVNVGTGMLAQEGVQAGLNKAGVDPVYSEAAGNVAGLGAGMLAHGVLEDSAPVRAWRKMFGDETTAKAIPSAVEAGSDPGSAAVEAWNRKFGGNAAAEPSPVAKSEATPVAEAPAANAPAVRSGGKPTSRAQSPFGADERVSEAPVGNAAEQPVAAEPAAKPVDEALVRKRPLLDENGEPLRNAKGVPREKTFGTKIDLEAQPEIAKAIDDGAAARAEQKGQAPEERSAMMRDHVARLNDSIAAGEPVHMVYDSSKAENMDAPPDPATRQAEHEARLVDPSLSQEAAKSIVPESYSVSKGNDVLVHGKSLDKQLSNGEKLMQMAAGQKLKTPYTPETAGVEMALDLRKGLDNLPKAKQNFWALANRESPGTVFQRALEKRGIDPIETMEETKETLRLDRIEKILKPDETPAVDAVRASAISGTLKTPVDAFTPVVKKALAKKAAAESKNIGTVGEKMQKSGLFEPGQYTEDERLAIDTYKSDGHALINRYLATDPEGAAAGKYQDVNDLQSALSKSSLSQDSTLYRGISGKYGESLAKTIQPGQVIEPGTFQEMSGDLATAKSYSGAFGGKGVVLRVKAPKGTPAIIPGVDKFNGAEASVILGHDTAYKVLKVTERDGVKYVDAELTKSAGEIKRQPWTLDEELHKIQSGAEESAKPAVPKSDADLEARLQASIDQAQAAKAAKAATVQARASEPVAGEPRFTTEPAYGRSINIAVPGEATRYKARYAVREASDVYASHNPQSFEANPDYEHANERDYSDPQNAARVVRDSSKDNFDPEFITSESPTAEHGPTIVDQRGNALGGNSRAMVVKRVYDSKNGTAAKYRSALEEKAPQFGISSDDLQRFKDPVLVRERVGPVDATTEVADYNRKAAADLTPDEQAVADGKRISEQTMGKIMGNLEAGDHESLADALRGDNGAEIVNSLEKDGMISPQEKAGLIQGDSLTAVAKDRIAKAMVGRLFESSADLKNIAPDMRNKLEKIAPQVARVETREGWTLTPKVREALSLVEEMRAAGSKNVDQYFKQDSIGGEPRGEYSPEAQAIAKTLLKGPMQAAMSFKRYANEETNSRPGAPGNLFGALTQREAFDDAFVKRRGEAGSAPILGDFANAIAKKLGRKAEDDIVTVKGDDGKLISLAVRKDFKGGFQGKTTDFRTPDELSKIAGDGWKEALAAKGYKPENVVGSADFTPREEGDFFTGKTTKTMQPGVAFVEPDFRRQGIASRMYDDAAKSFPEGHTLSDSPIGRKSDGQAFRAAYDRGAIASKITDAMEAARKTDSPQSLKRIPEGSGMTVSKLQAAVPGVTGADLQALENAGRINIMRGSVPTSSPLSNGGIPLPGEKYPAVRVSFKANDAERGSAPILVDLAQKVKDKIDGPDVGLEQNYSGLGAAETKFVRNLGQIKRAAPEAVPALLKAASPNAQATVRMMMVMPKIEKALGPDLSTTDFKRVLIQDRLNAIRDTWEAWGRDAHSLDDRKLVASLGKGVNGLLWAMQDKQGLPGNLVETAASLAENKDIAGLRDFLHSTFADAAHAVRDVMTPEEFVEHSNKTGFQKGLDIYKAELEPMLEANQARKEGAFSTAKGEFDTYYPLDNRWHRRIKPAWQSGTRASRV